MECATIQSLKELKYWQVMSGHADPYAVWEKKKENKQTNHQEFFLEEGATARAWSSLVNKKGCRAGFCHVYSKLKNFCKPWRKQVKFTLQLTLLPQLSSFPFLVEPNSSHCSCKHHELCWCKSSFCLKTSEKDRKEGLVLKMSWESHSSFHNNRSLCCQLPF